MARRRRAPQPPEQQVLDLDSAIDQMPDSYLQCRSWQHSWRPHTVRTDPGTGAWDEVTKCSRCKLLRHQLIDSRGRLVGGNRYDYAQVPGYLLPRGAHNDADTRSTIRLARLQRTIAASDKNRRNNLRAV